MLDVSHKKARFDVQIDLHYISEKTEVSGGRECRETGKKLSKRSSEVLWRGSSLGHTYRRLLSAKGVDDGNHKGGNSPQPAQES
jgi:hypothetical protein